MKALRKCKFALFALTAAMFTLAAVCFMPQTAGAEGQFKMVSGAYIRVTPENSGIRFMAEVADVGKNYRMLIVPADYLTDNNITEDYVVKLNEAYPEQTFSDVACTPFEYEGKTVISAAMINMQDHNFNRDFTGIAYYTEGEADDLTYTYAAFDSGADAISNSRNIAKVASAYLNEGNTENQAAAETMIEKAYQAEGVTFGFEYASQNLAIAPYEYNMPKVAGSFDIDVIYEITDTEGVIEQTDETIKAVSAGSFTMTAKIGDGSKFYSASEFTVTQPPAGTWIDTDTPAYAQLNESTTWLSEYDGESGVIRIDSQGEGAAMNVKLALPAESYSESDIVKIRARGNPEKTAIFGCSQPEYIDEANSMALAGYWRDYYFKISDLLGSEVTLSQLAQNAVITFAADTEYMYIAEAVVIPSAEEAGNVTYFNREYGSALSGTRLYSNASGEKSVARTQEITLPGEDWALKLFAAGERTARRDVMIDSPFITDISGYQYLYYWIYNDSECAVRLSYNDMYDYYLVQPGEWTRVVLTKNADGTNFTAPSGRNVFNSGSASYPASVTNISSFGVRVQPEDLTSTDWEATDVYFSAFRVTNTLVQATGGLENTTVLAGSNVTIPQVNVSGADSFEQKTFVVSGGSRTEVAAGSEYTFAAAGAYTLRYEVYVNGLLSDVLTQSVSVINDEPGNLTYFNHSFGMEMSDVHYNAGVSLIKPSQDFTHGDDEYSLRVYSESAQQQAARLFWFYNPVITDISDYQYMYFYVYNNSASGIRLSYNNVWDYYIVAPGEWTLVVLTRNAEGTNFTTPSNEKANVFNTGNASYPASVDNLYGFTVQIQTQVNNTATPETTDVYFSSFYVSNELPSA